MKPCSPALPIRALSVWVAFLSILPVNAEDDTQGWNGHTYGLFWENDAVARSDRHYTQGAGIWYVSPDYSQPAWLFRLSERLPTAGVSAEAHKVGFALTQKIYTPEDLRESGVVEDERPYAGWLYATLTLQRRGLSWFDSPGLDVWGIDLGVVGPPSVAEQTQKAWHGLDPSGWDNQLKSEPGLVLYYDRYSLFRFQGATSGWMADLIPSFGAALGNVDMNAHVGVLARMGYNIRDEFAAASQPLRRGIFVFASAEGRYVVRNLFLDGNTWRASHRIDKEPFVADLTLGLTVLVKRVEITLRQTLRTREFEGQRTNDSFGAALVNLRF